MRKFIIKDLRMSDDMPFILCGWDLRSNTVKIIPAEWKVFKRGSTGQIVDYYFQEKHYIRDKGVAYYYVAYYYVAYYYVNQPLKYVITLKKNNIQR